MSNSKRIEVDRDTGASVCGLLKSIIEVGTPQEQWEAKLEHAVTLYDSMCKRVVIAKGGGQ